MNPTGQQYPVFTNTMGLRDTSFLLLSYLIVFQAESIHALAGMVVSFVLGSVNGSGEARRIAYHRSLPWEWRFVVSPQTFRLPVCEH